MEPSTELCDAGTAELPKQDSRGAGPNLCFVEAHEQAEH